MYVSVSTHVSKPGILITVFIHFLTLTEKNQLVGHNISLGALDQALLSPI